MPKILNIKLSVPSRSRPDSMKKWLGDVLRPHNMTVESVVDNDELYDKSEDGYFWFKCERASTRSIAQRVGGRWYTVNEAGPVTMEELNRRGWYLDEAVS